MKCSAASACLRLPFCSLCASSAPSAAQEPKGTLIFAVELLAAQTLDPILEGRPGNAVYQAVNV